MTQKSPSGHHRTTLSGCVFANKAFIDNQKMLNSNISSTRPENMANFGPLMAEIGSGLWGTPAIFNGFRVLASLLQRRRSPEANQTLHGVWPSPGLLHNIYIFGVSCPMTEFRHVQNSLSSKSCLLLYWQPLRHGTPAAGSDKVYGVVQGMGLRNFRRGRHLYSAGRPSRWA